MSVVRKRRPMTDQRHKGAGQGGQALVEFALVILVFMMVFMGIFEFGLAFNAFVGVNRASQYAALSASVLGRRENADCQILDEIELDVTPPINRANIIQVEIQRTSLSGPATPLQHIRYVRTGVMRPCTRADGRVAYIPYDGGTSPLAPPYPWNERCATLNGCLALGADRTTVDNIGVAVRYRHDWVTPLAAIITSLPGGASGWTFVQRNIFRMEPVQ